MPNVVSRTTVAVVIAAVASAAVSCGSITTAADEQAIRYEGGLIFPQDPTFKGCQGSSLQEFGDPGDTGYNYPSGQRTFKFSHDPGSDSPPLTVSSPGPGGTQPVEMEVSGTVTFTPNFQNCDGLKAFHESIGIKYAAWTPEGWTKMMLTYIKDPTDKAADTAALGYNWVALTGSVDSKNAWEAAALVAIPDLVKKQAKGNFFTIYNVFLHKPELPRSVKNAINDVETARLQGQASDQVAEAAQRFPGGPAAYQEFLRQQSVNKAIENGSVKVIPIPQGSPVIVQGG